MICWRPRGACRWPIYRCACWGCVAVSACWVGSVPEPAHRPSKSGSAARLPFDASGRACPGCTACRAPFACGAGCVEAGWIRSCVSACGAGNGGRLNRIRGSSWMGCRSMKARTWLRRFGWWIWGNLRRGSGGGGGELNGGSVGVGKAPDPVRDYGACAVCGAECLSRGPAGGRGGLFAVSSWAERRRAARDRLRGP